MLRKTGVEQGCGGGATPEGTRLRFAFGKTGKERRYGGEQRQKGLVCVLLRKTGVEQGCGGEQRQKGLACVLLRKTEDRPVCGLVPRLPLAAWIEPFESLPSIKQNLGYTEVYPRFWYARRDSFAFCFAKQRIDQSADWSPGCRWQPGLSRSSPFSDRYKKWDAQKRIPLFGTPEGTRTPNPRNRNPMLYPLSHWRISQMPSYYSKRKPVCKAYFRKNFEEPGFLFDTENGCMRRCTSYTGSGCARRKIFL